jgi:hypothetical protein
MRGPKIAIFLIACALLPLAGRADTCNTPLIPNFHRNQPVGSSTMSLAWDAPGGVTNPTYEIVHQAKSDYCSTSLQPEVVVGTTNATSFTYTISPANVVVVVHVRLASDHCILSSYLVGDSFIAPPSKPPAPTVANGSVSVAYDDGRSQLIQFQRASGTDFNTIPIGAVNVCTPNPKTIGDSPASGIYRYRTFVSNSGGFAVSDFVTVAVGNATPLRIVSFTATPSTVALGNPSSIATLAWTTEGATAVSISPFPGAVNPNGTITAKPTTTTTYTLTASQGAQTATATVTVNVLSLPFLNITKLVEPVLQIANVGGGTSIYALTNVGGTPTTVTLSQNDVITQTPTTFTLESGATQAVTMTGTPQPEGSVKVPFEISYTTGPNLSRISSQVLVFSAKQPTGPATADPQQLRVDVQGEPGTNPTGTVTFTNNGTAPLTGILSADVEWIIPQSGQVTIPAKQSGTFTFTCDRAKRPDSSSPAGSLAGHLKLSFLKPTGTTFAKDVLQTPTAGNVPSVSIVRVVDTVQGAVTTAGVPALLPNEVALFVPGVGHTTTTAGTVFASDVSVLNSLGNRAVDDVKMYFTSVSGAPASSKATSLPTVPGQTNIAVSDVVKTVFAGSSDTGTLHIRSKDADKLAVAATNLATNNAAGTLGNSIPILRSDRAVAIGSSLVFTGLQKDSKTHTDLYIQETAGLPASIQIDFLAIDGSTISSRPLEGLDAFRLRQLKDIVPANAVAAIITNSGSGGGKIAGYAVPVDEASGDTWTVNDWSSQLGYAPTESVIIPIAGSVHGTNDTFYRSDLSITNRGTGAATMTFTFIGRDGAKVSRSITISGHQTALLDNVIASTFGITSDTTGYIVLKPDPGNSFAVSSRTFSTVGAKTATFSSGVPVVAASSALTQGSSRPIGGLSDAGRNTVLEAKPGTFRTNFALMETAGVPATVRVTFRFTFPAGDKVQGIGAAFRDYPLNGNGFIMLNSIASQILGAARLQYGDLQNVSADFQVIDGDGAVLLFTSTVDNASGDSILRTQ